MRQQSWRSRGDRPELLFRDAVVQGGLNGLPGVPNGCWWLVRVVVELFDELSWYPGLPCGPEDEWDQVDAGVSVELFLLFAFGHVAWASAGGRYESGIGGKGCDNGRVNMVRVAT